MDDLFAGFAGEGLSSKEQQELISSKDQQETKSTPTKQSVAETAKQDRAAASTPVSASIDADEKLRKAGLTSKRIQPPSPTQESDNEQNNEPDTKQPRVQRPPAKVYPFQLDTFQQEAVGYLEKNESVLVSAHTSAGKTAVAEYAIAMALRDNQRVVYTSPIKALSNQKYRDLHAEFSDVGLMTGDVTINPNASCLVMTTEILRSMLYRGSEILREVAWAIFDEVHYMRDRDRGVVWEESIILLPHKVRYVFLSATIPNGAQFCRWVSKVHKQPCHIVYTEYRPTPLQHYMFPSGGEGLFLIVDEKSKFRDDNFDRCMANLGSGSTALEDAVREGTGKSKEARKAARAKKTSKIQDLQRIVDLVIQRAYDPVIVFSFSKKDCETYALKLSKLDFNEDDKKAIIKEIYENAIDALNDDDKQLPQVKTLLPLLQRGIGIHHGGLLPILKEVTEILFGEGLLKVLVATETFAMGINMPAKTVVFTATRKFDGTDFRQVRAGEYIQMSGRAGRRGKDDRGIVIQMVDEKIDPPDAKEMMTGQADPLSSTFHLGYNMLLNLFRVEEPEYMIRNSLYMFQQEEAVPALKEQLSQLEAEIDQIDLGKHESAIEELYHLQRQRTKAHAALRTKIADPVVCVPFLQAGRLVKVVDHERNEEWGWGIVVSQRKIKAPKGSEESAASEKRYVVDILLPIKSGGTHSTNPVPAVVNDDDTFARNTTYSVVPCSLDIIDTISSVVIFLPKDLRSADARETAWKSIVEVKRRIGAELPRLHPINDMKMTEPEVKNLVTSLESFDKQIAEADATKQFKDSEDEKQTLYKQFTEKMALRAKRKVLEKEIRSTESLPMRDQLKRMKAVLRRLGHIDKDNVVQLKGRVACEISTCDELLATELVLGGAFNDLPPEVLAAVCSCLVYTEKGDGEVKAVRNKLQGPLNTLQAAARKVAEVQKDSKVAIDVDEYVKSFRSDMMELVYHWCKGAKFSEICGMTEIFEGTIIRCIRRQEELMRQLCAAAKVVGDTSLEQNFMAAIKLIKRDIIFAASLYL